MKTGLTRVLIIACFVSFPAFGQEPPIPTKDPKAMALLTGAMVAMGGASIPAIADTRAEITIRSFSGDTAAEAPVVLKTLGRKAWRIEGGNARNGPATILNGGWVVSQSDDEVREFPAVAVEEAGNWRIPWLTIIADVNDPEVEVTYVGEEQGGKVQHGPIVPEDQRRGLSRSSSAM